MTHPDEDPDIEALMKAARGGRFSQWLDERSKAAQRAFVGSSRRWHWWVIVQMPLRLAVLLLGIYLVSFTGWTQTLGGVLVGLIGAWGATYPLGRAQAYRSGWVDRGSHDRVMHHMVCDDPITQEQFDMAMLATNMDAYKRD